MPWKHIDQSLEICFCAKSVGLKAAKMGLSTRPVTTPPGIPLPPIDVLSQNRDPAVHSCDPNPSSPPHPRPTGSLSVILPYHVVLPFPFSLARGWNPRQCDPSLRPAEREEEEGARRAVVRYLPPPAPPRRPLFGALPRRHPPLLFRKTRRRALKHRLHGPRRDHVESHGRCTRLCLRAIGPLVTRGPAPHHPSALINGFSLLRRPRYSALLKSSTKALYCTTK
jgi:hypothetical protein